MIVKNSETIRLVKDPVRLWMAYSTSVAKPNKPTGTGMADGWSDTLSMSSKWFSQKLSETRDGVEPWSEPVKLQGNDGLNGCMPRYRGVWISTDTYEYTDFYRDIVLHKGKYYALITRSTTSLNQSPETNTSVWEVMEGFDMVATKVLLAESAWVDIFGARGIAIGDDAANRWEMTAGKIIHKKSLMELTSEGGISMPSKWSLNPDGSGSLACGNITWTSAGATTFIGEITASGGTIGGFTIGENQLSATNGILISPTEFSYTSDDNYFKLNLGVLETNNIALNGVIEGNKWNVSEQGVATFSNLIASNINVTGGKIGGWDVTDNALHGGTEGASSVFPASGQFYTQQTVSTKTPATTYQTVGVYNTGIDTTSQNIVISGEATTLWTLTIPEFYFDITNGLGKDGTGYKVLSWVCEVELLKGSTIVDRKMVSMDLYGHGSGTNDGKGKPYQMYIPSFMTRNLKPGTYTVKARQKLALAWNKNGGSHRGNIYDYKISTPIDSKVSIAQETMYASLSPSEFIIKKSENSYFKVSVATDGVDIHLKGNVYGNVINGEITRAQSLYVNVGKTDFGRIIGGSTGDDKGFLEIGTAVSGDEPIYVRQYSGQFATLLRTATLLDASGNTSFPGTVSSNGQVLVATNDARMSNARNAADVKAWAKAENKPTYGISEITGLTGALDGKLSTSGTAANSTKFADKEIGEFPLLSTFTKTTDNIDSDFTQGIGIFTVKPAGTLPNDQWANTTVINMGVSGTRTQLASSTSDNLLYYRKRSSAWGGWETIYSTANSNSIKHDWTANNLLANTVSSKGDVKAQGDVVAYSATANVYMNATIEGGGTGGVGNLFELGDVSLPSSLINNYVLAYDAATKKWTAKESLGTGGAKVDYTGLANVPTEFMPCAHDHTGGTYGVSDQRLKYNVTEIDGIRDIIKALRPVKYNWTEEAKNKYSVGSDYGYGFIAQEVQKVIPEMVKRISGHEHLGVDYSKLAPFLVAMVQELMKDVDELKSKRRTRKSE